MRRREDNRFVKNEVDSGPLLETGVELVVAMRVSRPRVGTGTGTGTGMGTVPVIVPSNGNYS